MCIVIAEFYCVRIEYFYGKSISPELLVLSSFISLFTGYIIAFCGYSTNIVQVLVDVIGLLALLICIVLYFDTFNTF